MRKEWLSCGRRYFVDQLLAAERRRWKPIKKLAFHLSPSKGWAGPQGRNPDKSVGTQKWVPGIQQPYSPTKLITWRIKLPAFNQGARTAIPDPMFIDDRFQFRRQDEPCEDGFPNSYITPKFKRMNVAAEVFESSREVNLLEEKRRVRMILSKILYLIPACRRMQKGRADMRLPGFRQEVGNRTYRQQLTFLPHLKLDGRTQAFAPLIEKLFMHKRSHFIFIKKSRDHYSPISGNWPLYTVIDLPLASGKPGQSLVTLPLPRQLFGNQVSPMPTGLQFRIPVLIKSILFSVSGKHLSINFYTGA